MFTPDIELAGIYVHVPFCSAICPYCDFAVTTPGDGRRQSYLPAQLAEIDLVAGDPWRGATPAPAADTIYFGGGTPSLLEPIELGEILEALRHRLGLIDTPWLALETNPEDVTTERLSSWRELGVRFLSIGVQSFNDPRLALIGRRHTAAEARSAVAAAVAAGFETVSVDLIYGLPGQAPAEWRQEIETAIALGPQHLSCYQLTVEPGTPFSVMRRRGRLRELTESRQAELFLLTHSLLADKGLEPYEVSNFAAAPAHRSRHNTKYWRHAPYLGLGPSAHSFDGRRRWWNHRALGPWARATAMGRRPLAGDELLTDEQLALEELMLALRTPEGVNLGAFRRRHRIDLLAVNPGLCERLEADELVLIDRDHLQLTPAGLVVAEGLAASLRLRPPPP